MRKSLTLRLTLYFGVASTLVLVAIGYLIGATVERHFADLDRADLESRKELVRRVLAKARTAAELADAAPALEDALAGQMDIFVQVAGSDGRPIYVTPDAAFPARWPGVGGTAEDELAAWAQRGHEYRGLRTILTTEAAGRVTLTLGMNIDYHSQFMHAFYRTLWAAIAAGIVLTAVLGWLAARRGIAPVRDMARVARNITATRLDDRLAVGSLPVELVDLADAFNAMLARLEDSFRRLSEFSSDLAHELRTPIGNLMTQTQVALARSRSADEYRDVLYSNVEEFDRLARMIADMLFLAKADNGLIVPRSETVDLASEVRDLFDYYDAFVEERGVKLAVDGEGSISGERLMIRRAIGNLVSNAVNHSPPGGQVDVRIGAAADGSVRLSVENRGETIPAEHLPRLFDRFYRVDPARQRLSEGAGLGLAITKSIVAAHHGTVRAYSKDGVTRVEMVFPKGNGAFLAADATPSRVNAPTQG
jgi:two-component system heavy metal sensor histidine kinase CusS